ncbi:carotenoid-cleaving dioxygenase, mitochondrial-like isoform X3 [Salvelinus fontinalis]|uniref:carotenoid-cleaving dioxygenase, mitochondrial-like isoform X3 n=1 Tax=Salvelinus fontinalis TaxID=8038 RepID=UPI0024862A73|nr:carotenoid-cleaving dioxygenase, mitochondrial-like isoform X3 [Salvelinus fontinalis]
MPPIKLEVSDVTTTPSSDAKPKELNKCSQLELKGLESIAPLVRSVEETPEPIATEVRGTIPTWIRGNLLRNGPGKFEFGNQHYNHWFDGMAMLHQFKIEDGKVTYRSRFLQSDAYKKNSERDRIMVSEFGTVAMPDPCKNFFLRFLSRFEMIGALYNIIKVPPMKNNPEETLEGAKVLCSIVPADKARPSYYHSFAMSENYVVFIEQPIKMDLLKIVTAKLRGKGISEGVYWDPKQDTVFHLVDKHTGQTSSVKFHTKALSVFHQINAFEEDGFLMLDMCCSDNGEAINNYLIQNLRKSGEALDQVYNTTYRAFPRRFVLPLNVTDDTPTGVNLNTRPASSATSFKTAIDKVVCQFEDLHGEDLYEYGGLEFPQINYSKFNTRPYRYFYGCGFRHLVGDSLLKIDLEGKKVKVWYQKGLFPSEPVFVPSPDAVEEDDGVILSVVVTPTEDKSTFLLVLDAKTWEELGRAEVPVNIPYGFHGTFNPTT